MAKVKRKKNLQEMVQDTKQSYQSGISRSMVNPMLGQVATTMPAQTGGLAGQNIPAQVGGLAGMGAGGMQPEGMLQQTDAMEMQRQSGMGAAPMMQPKKVKVKKKKDSKAITEKEAKKFAETNPMSPTTWANIGNNPADYPAYLATFKSKK
jgi:hypothetical protein